MRLLYALILLLSITASARAESYADFNSALGHSDFATPVHITAGATVAGLTTYYLPETWPKTTRWIVGALAGVAAGCLSESLDKNWDNKDLGEWAVGGMVGASLISFKF